MKIIKTIGSTIFALPFLVFGFNHLTKANDLAFIVPGWLPGGAFWVYLTGVVFVIAALSIIARKYVVIGAGVLAFQLLIFILIVHLPALMADASNQGAIINLLKDTALLGAALLIGGLHCRCTDCVGGPVGDSSSDTSHVS